MESNNKNRHNQHHIFVIVLLSIGIFRFENVTADDIVNPGTYSVHDPSLICEGNYFYAFHTGGLISWRRSSDLTNWTNMGSVLPFIPQWVINKVPGIGGLWAPGPTYHNGKYYLCYSGSLWGTNTSTIGLLSNRTLNPSSPIYEWVDEGEIISSANQSVNYNTIDGEFLHDASGYIWLVFGSFWGGIYIMPLNQETLKPLDNPPVLTRLAKRSSGSAIEAPYIVYRNGYFYLFVNWDSCCRGVDSTYKIMVGRSTGITGPYYDKNGVSMAQGGGTLFVGNEGRWIGPGHMSVVMKDGRDYMAYHTYDAQNDGRHTLRVRRLYWSEDLWPELVDIAPPQPDPMTWEVEPYESSPGNIMMVATTAADQSEVEYFFECVSGGGRSSGWQNSPIYIDNAIVQLASSYRVRARDTSSLQNLTGDSTEAAVTIQPYPYGGKVRQISDRIQVQNYDGGGQGITYYDTTLGNAGGQFRTREDVDIVAIQDGYTDYAVDSIETGEWLIYTVNSIETETDLYVRIAADQNGGQIRFWLNDDLIVTIDVPNTGSLTMWETVSAKCLSLPELENAKLKLEFIGTGFRLNWFQFGNKRPYLGSPSAVPGQIEFEDFDTGGLYVSYYDKTSANGYGQYRPDEFVDIMSTIDNTSAYAVVAFAEEWLEYTCDIIPGFYTITVRSASPHSAQCLTMSIDDLVLATFTLPNTGGWDDAFQNTFVSDVYLPGGRQVLRFHLETRVSMLNYVEFNRQYNAADITKSGRVDMDDLAILSAQWLGAPGTPSADIAPNGSDGVVDIMDMLMMAENWLEI